MVRFFECLTIILEFSEILVMSLKARKIKGSSGNESYSRASKRFDFCDCEVISIEVSHLYPFDQGLTFLLFVAISKFATMMYPFKTYDMMLDTMKMLILIYLIEEEENDEEEEEEVEAEDEELEDFISDEDKELAVGDMCLDDVDNEDDDLDSNDEPTPSNTTPNTSANPSPNPSTSSIPNHTYPLPNSHAFFSSTRIQTPVLTSEESPQPDVDACRSISSAIQLENPPNLDSSIEKKYVQKLSETQSTQATVDGSTPSTPGEPSYDEQMKIWIDANDLTKRSHPNESFTQTLKVHIPSKIMVLDDVQAKLTLEQAKSKKQIKKTILPNLPSPKSVLDSLSESEDGGEDENDNGGGGGGADE
ncbi:LOW QUALITY PROTEIN: hypothetical protein Cgig2_028282 [Carnegiea gigantea]|uniref:Uncharacterized protein n=1 Tax=Carnegiea gigantea TaxID=171969 RepID=A0A9Q1JJR3_9CARY|nr:LOW QUALITY PROTEIN: hypothetical protein Cgig2_028282 [Carnegiea gigantea]